MAAKRRTKLILWILAVVITLVAVAYQRMTGPTYPVRGKVTVGGKTIAYALSRSCTTTEDAVIDIPVDGAAVTGEYRWKRARSQDEWTVRPLDRRNDKLTALIPRQPAAGKVLYQITLVDQDGKRIDLSSAPVVIRFKGSVPALILIPHILFMFAAMLIGTRAGLGAMLREKNNRWMTVWTTILLFLGGLLLGPIVQKYAFGEYWTGWPFGHDLTDNKTALAMLFWIIAIWRMPKKGNGRGWIIAAAIVQLLVYSIPHSVLGSELDYTESKPLTAELSPKPEMFLNVYS